MEFTAYQKRTAAWTGIAVLTGIFVWLLAPVLTPFLVAAVLAYALNPLVNRVHAWFRGKTPRWLAVTLVMIIFMLTVTGVVMVLTAVLIVRFPISSVLCCMTCCTWLFGSAFFARISRTSRPRRTREKRMEGPNSPPNRSRPSSPSRTATRPFWGRPFLSP